MSMIAVNKLEKVQHLKFLLSHLRQGKTTVALEYLKHQINAKNLDKWGELIGYLENINSKLLTTSAAEELVKLSAVDEWRRQ
ncbi:hypothetical protein [Chroococcidiopsis cubana]|uniref:hypothetical protein n=1 Tax=Chroococcidiopsis cubana TaxID=171392 RepID=UPI002ACE6817|nr:hypothetical protein [Chroococcidiopsis cubana]